MLHSSIIWLLPIVFIFHDFEEIMMMEVWIKKNSNFLQNKFPKMGYRILSSYKNLSTASFSFAVFEEFLILVLSVFLAIQFQWYFLWVACFMAFSLHLIMHIIQWLIIRRYIPAIITSFLSLFYSCFAFSELINYHLYKFIELIGITLVGLVFMIINLYLIHKMAASFEKFLTDYH